jgi:hypothetical protein
MKAMEQSAYEAPTMGYVHHAHPRMVSQQEGYFVPQANCPSFQGYDDTFGPSESIFLPGYSIRGSAHGAPCFMGSSWHNEPFTANMWGNSDGLVTQSWSAFSPYMGEVNGSMNYSQLQQTTPQGQGYGDPYAWGQELFFNNEQQSMQDRAFSAQIPMNDTRMYEDAAAPNEDEEEKLFSSAFG